MIRSVLTAKFTRHVSTALLLLVGMARSAAQDFSYIHYGIAEGLPSSEVYQSYQDRKGFLWFATDNGVARFDGAEIISFHAKEGLPDPVVFGFHEDLRGKLWFRSYSGKLSWFENDSIRKFPYNDTLAALCGKSILHSITVDSAGQVWLGAGEFTGRISEQGAISIEQNPRQQIYFRTVETGFIFGLYWPSSLVNSFKIDGKTFPVDLPERNYDNQTVNAVRWGKHVYLSLANSVFRYDGKTVARVLSDTDHILSLSVDHDNRLWVGYREKGVICYRDESFSDFFTMPFLKGKSVTKVLEDNQQGFWISTLQSGVYYIPNFSLKNYFPPGAARIVTAKSFGHRTLAGDDNGNLLWIDNKTVTPTASIALSGKSIFSVFIDSRKQIWASATRGSVLLDSMFRVKNSMQIQNDCFEREDTVFALARLRVSKYNPDGTRAQEITFAAIHRSMLDFPPYVLMSSRTGLDVFTHDFGFIKSLEEFKNFKISRMVQLNDSVVLIATIGSGYLLLRKDHWDIVGRAEGRRFIGDNVYTVAQTDSLLWMGTEKGIAITSQKALLRNQPDFTFLDHHSGLISDKINVLTIAGDRVWAFTDQGMTALPVDRGKFNSPAPRFYLKNTQVNHVPSDLRKVNNLSFHENNIALSFGFISFSNQHILLRTKLKAGDPWNYADNRSREYYALAPGNYDFQLQYSADMVHWVDALPAIHFSISQPWWRTSWFQAIIIISIILVLYAAFGSRLSVLKDRNERLSEQNESKKGLLQAEIETLERERSRIAKDLHDGVGMNLTVLKLHLHELLKKYQSPDSTLVEEQLKSTIQEIRSIVHNLTPTGITLFGLAESVKDYIARTTAHLGVSIELSSSGKKVVAPRVSLFAFRILQELLTNSLKHSRGSRITIRINGFESSVNIIYQDNGIGFDPSTCKLGSGLMNIQSRLDAVEGTMEFSSAGGVLYILNIPLKVSREAEEENSQPIA